MRYEWDETKNRQNERKHDISFDRAALVFDDPLHLVYRDRVDEKTGEERWQAVGVVEGLVLLLVVHVYRKDENEEEIIRIISAREADKHECRRYQKQAVDA